MRAIRIIFRRELSSNLRSPFSWALAAGYLLVTAILFKAFAFGTDKAPLSALVLERYFMFGGLVAIIAGVVLSFRLIAEERQTHSMVLLSTSPVRDSEIVVGKFLAAFVFLALLLAMSLYMPLMLKIGNKISFAQIMVGYLGMLLVGSTTLAIGIFASSLTRYILVAVAVAAVLTFVMGYIAQFGKVLDEGPAKDVFVGLDMWWTHYMPSFMRGILNLKDVVYYVAVTYFFLLLSVKTLEAKRWQ
jgi:ABC-2 type transport system permease protein